MVARWSGDMEDWLEKYNNLPRRVRRKSKYRSIDDPWEDSSTVKPFDKPKIPQRFHIAKARTLKPVEKYYYNAIVRDQSGSMEGNVKILEISPALHKMMMESILGTREVQDMPEDDPLSEN